MKHSQNYPSASCEYLQLFVVRIVLSGAITSPVDACDIYHKKPWQGGAGIMYWLLVVQVTSFVKGKIDLAKYPFIVETDVSSIIHWLAPVKSLRNLRPRCFGLHAVSN